MTKTTEAATRADFSRIRYAQVWEDADILVEALDVRPTDTVVSISSAGDNALALLGAGAERVVALDLNPSQLACLELRVAAYRELPHAELLVLMGSRPGTAEARAALYARCRARLSPAVRAFWDGQPESVTGGIGAPGKFENYFRLFRTRVLPLVHGRKTVVALLRGGTPAERERFYEERWNTWRWRLLFKVFFSRFMMGRLGRDPAFFKYVEGSVADRILGRTRHALVALNPAENPYLHWILTGTHGEALPWALRADNFERIKSRLDRLEWHELTLEAFLERERVAGAAKRVMKFNLSDIFEYMSEENTAAILASLAEASAPGGRLAYWNMLAPRRRPESLAEKLRSREDLAGA
ncbi:MAG: S-adenosylmethionine:diacylglycerol 3-amino-3-carboxypropyl transferase, partial [Rariglobus sp.]|nr:S-adenosylmethionine:diacylglycerol 3-amino-3-carboxypropyl transferase [Rariglobus sp.]